VGAEGSYGDLSIENMTIKESSSLSNAKLELSEPACNEVTMVVVTRGLENRLVNNNRGNRSLQR
jgi:hypothetical protein